MARRRYFRYYPRTRVAKKKWASNFKTYYLSSDTSPYVPYQVLVENKQQDGAPTPTVIKCGNFKVQGDVNLSNVSSFPDVLYMRAFVLFVPEGWNMNLLSDIPLQHPEWIMSWTVIDLPIAAAQAASGGNKFSFSSRLKRNLNSGDKVVVYFQSDVLVSPGPTTQINFSAQYWTCAN